MYYSHLFKLNKSNIFCSIKSESVEINESDQPGENVHTNNKSKVPQNAENRCKDGEEAEEEMPAGMKTVLKTLNAVLLQNQQLQQMLISQN